MSLPRKQQTVPNLIKLTQHHDIIQISVQSYFHSTQKSKQIYHILGLSSFSSYCTSQNTADPPKAAKVEHGLRTSNSTTAKSQVKWRKKNPLKLYIKSLFLKVFKQWTFVLLCNGSIWIFQMFTLNYDIHDFLCTTDIKSLRQEAYGKCLLGNN